MDLHADSLKWIDAHQDKLREVNRKIWMLAEPPLKEYQSSVTLVHWLEENGFEVQKGVGGLPTAFAASFGDGSPVIGILAEFDALPGISQEATAERKLRAGTIAAHACGHSLFGTASTAAAIAIKEAMARSKAKGTIRLYGSPAEETGEGKMYMAMAGAYSDADVLLAWHPSTITQSAFEYSKALLSVKFTFHGVSAHASTTPH
ncbi:MAG: M20/M25/M40 family metallo-hydrolase, partial [Chloroflexota bacterium]